MTNSDQSTRDMLEHAWRYFDLHAQQRMSLFNYFLIASGSVAAGLAASLQRSGLFQILGTGLGALLILISFVFWKLDQRSAFLVKHAEEALTELESTFQNPAVRLVYREPLRTAARESGFIITRMWTYGAVFRLVYAVMGIVGLTGAAISWARFKGWLA